MGTATIYGMNTQAICESTMSTAGLSNRLIVRCILLGDLIKAHVSKTRLQINGAMVIPSERIALMMPR